MSIFLYYHTVEPVSTTSNCINWIGVTVSTIHWLN